MCSKNVTIKIPDEHFSILEFKKERLPVIAVLNTALLDFSYKDIFGWHLSIIIDLLDVVENGMPSKKESLVLDPFCDEIDKLIESNGNALFFVRETWNEI
jgi:hypothetical protein